VVRAVECALAIQTTMAERNAPVEPRRRMWLRIGVNLGDVISDKKTVYGDGINVAARLESLAEPGGICISSKVYEELHGKLNLACEDLGEPQLKNIDRPVRVYRVRSSKAAIGLLPSSTTGLTPMPQAASSNRVPLSGPAAAKPTAHISSRPSARRMARYAAVSIMLLLLAHYLTIVKLDLDPVFLRGLAVAIPLCAGFLLSRQIDLGWGAAFVLGATVGIASVAGMLVVVGMVDTTKVIPASRFEWQEAIEYVICITLAVMLGSALARAVRSILPLLTRTGAG